MNSHITVKPNSVAILGIDDGRAGMTETWFEEVTGYHIACFVHEAKSIDVDAVAEKDTFKGHPFIVTMDWVQRLKELNISRVLPLIYENDVRLRQVETCLDNGFELVSAIHPTVIILPDATIEPGVWISAGSIIGYKSEIETGVHIDAGVQVDHHNVLKRGCQLDPGVVAAGNVTFREACHVHTGVTIIPRIEIGRSAIVEAGSVVTRNIPADCTAMGVPARVIKNL